jgi:hypothetical protein
MSEAVSNYSRYYLGELSWILGRFILQTSRLQELEESVRRLQPSKGESTRWRLSVLGTDDPEADLKHIVEFNRRNAAKPSSDRMFIDAVEVKADSVEAIRHAVAVLSGHLEVYIEIPISDGARKLIDAVAEKHVRAKVRTGGVTAGMFPSPAQLAGFILLCVEAGTPFKATSGLHHALRSIQPLTYEASSPSGVMHGFLNVLLAAAFAYAGANEERVQAILSEESAEAFRFDDSGIFWRDQRLGINQLHDMRTRLFTSFGSCSFEEPASDLKALKLL